jgi:hypothetical protein
MYISVMLIHYRQYSTQRDYTQEEYNDLEEPHRRSRYQERRTTRKVQLRKT